MLKEFKEFINRGNVMDLAIGVVLGAAFTAIVNALVEGIIMPFVGLITGGGNMSGLFLALDGNEYASLQQAQEAGAAVLQYGLLIQAIIDFLLVSFVIFIVVKQLNKLKKQPEVEVTTKECPFCKSEIPLSATRCPHCTSELN